jgi:hypothetical protein
MGSQAKQEPVYYDTELRQYYTMKPPEPPKFGGLTEEAKNSPEYANYLQSVRDTRSYLGSGPQNTEIIDRFKPKFTPAQYPNMNILFPGLSSGLLPSNTSLMQPSGAMYGAGRFLAPQTNMLAPQTTNTGSK